MAEGIPRAARCIVRALVAGGLAIGASDGAAAATHSRAQPVTTIAVQGGTLHGQVPVLVSARPLTSVSSIEVRVGTRVVGAARRGRVAFNLDTRLLGNGVRRIVATVRTADGRRLTVGRGVLVLNAAPVAPPPPAADHGLEVPPPVAPVIPPPPSPFDPLPGTPSWTGDFETGTFSQWTNRSGDVAVQRVADDRIRLVPAPVAQGQRAVRIEVRRGDRWRATPGNRAELVRWTGETEGSERWYQWSTMFAPDYPYATSGWQIWTQWHAEHGGTQAPVRFVANGDEIGLETVESRSNGSPMAPRTLWSAPMDRGQWHTIRIHVRWSSDPRLGMVELWHDGVQVLPPTASATLIPGGTPHYLKQGLYRSDSIGPTAVLYHDAMMMTIIR